MWKILFLKKVFQIYLMWYRVGETISPNQHCLYECKKFDNNKIYVYQLVTMQENTQQPTYGQKAMGVSFNPGGYEPVDQIKSRCAELADVLHTYRNATQDGEVKRMLSIAITELQTAQMWGVKAVTWEGKVPDIGVDKE